MAPLFTIVIPTYNRPECLREAVASVLSQTIGDFECIVVDDAGDVPATVESPDPRIRMVRRRVQGGPGAARNTGLALATGAYVVFIDDDDLYTPDRLAVGLEGLKRAPITICWRRFVDSPPGNNRQLEGDVGDTILEGPVPNVGVATLPRALVPRFDERFFSGEDAEWWIRLAQVAPVSTVPRIGNLARRSPVTVPEMAPGARAKYRVLLLELHEPYFAARPRAAAYQWKRVGLLAREAGHLQLAQTAFRQAFRLAPDIAGLRHLLRSMVASSAPVRP